MSVGVIVLLGPPGSGKGTQAKALSQKATGWVHISTGDLFRAEIGSGSPLGLSVKDILAAGKLVSDDVTDKVFESQTLQILKAKHPVVLMLDGYPRTKPQAESLMRFCKKQGDLKTPVVVEFVISEQAVVDRLADRLINPRTGKIYHRVTNPPKKPGICDDDGGPLVQRPDDQPETIRKRFALYAEQRDGIVAAIGADRVRKVDAELDPSTVGKKLIEAIASEVGLKV